MKDLKIGFIGGGNMAAALISGLLRADYAPENIWVSEPHEQRRLDLAAEYGVSITDDNNVAAATVDVLVLAVKPQMMQQVLTAITVTLAESQPLLISIAAGLRSTDMLRWTGGDYGMVRCMPNTPSLLGCGISGLFPNEYCTATDKEHAEAVLQSAGDVVWVSKEADLDAVTAIAGSAPAYFFRFTEALIKAGEQLGLEHSAATKLATHTALGAARMMTETADDPATLRKKVTSPNGTTEQALLSFERSGLEQAVLDAAAAAANRAKTLADELGA